MFRRRYDEYIYFLRIISIRRPLWGRRRVEKGQKQQQEMDIERIKTRLQEFRKKAETQIGSQCIEVVSKFLVPLGHPVEDTKNTNIDWDNI